MTWRRGYRLQTLCPSTQGYVPQCTKTHFGNSTSSSHLWSPICGTSLPTKEEDSPSTTKIADGNSEQANCPFPVSWTPLLSHSSRSPSKSASRRWTYRHPRLHPYLVCPASKPMASTLVSSLRIIQTILRGLLEVPESQSEGGRGDIGLRAPSHIRYHVG